MACEIWVARAFKFQVFIYIIFLYKSRFSSLRVFLLGEMLRNSSRVMVGACPQQQPGKEPAPVPQPATVGAAAARPPAADRGGGSGLGARDGRHLTVRPPAAELNRDSPLLGHVAAVRSSVGSVPVDPGALHLFAKLISIL